MWKTKNSKWKTLDNAAKIFPSLAGREDPEVFRVSCTLKEEIDPAILQDALSSAIELYPAFTDTIRSGVFWYYLENTGLMPKVHQEETTPLMPLYGDQCKLLIDVSYFKNRINLEVFHALADGTGALVFLKTIVYFYLAYAHHDELYDISIETEDSTERERESDGFNQYFESSRGDSLNFEFLGDKEKTGKAYRFDKHPAPDFRQFVTEGRASVASIIKAAKSYGATVTEFLCAILILSVYDTMEPRDRKKSIVVAIPVNLRNYFDSNTLRNFFGMIHVSYDFSKNGYDATEDVIAAVKAAFKREITRENMEQKIASQMKMERHPIVRACPLFIKDLVVMSMQKLSMKRRTIVLSNMGVVKVQSEFEKYIDGFTVFNSSDSRQICLCSFGGQMSLTFSGGLMCHDVERAFFRRLAAYDDSITLATNYTFKELE